MSGNGARKKRKEGKKAPGENEEKILFEILGILVATIGLLSLVALFVGPEASTLYDIKQICLNVFGYTSIIVPAIVILSGVWLVWRREALLRAVVHVLLTGLLAGAWMNWGVLASVGGGYLAEMDYVRGGGSVSAYGVAGLTRAISLPGVFMLLFAVTLIYGKLALGNGL